MSYCLNYAAVLNVSVCVCFRDHFIPENLDLQTRMFPNYMSCPPAH